MKTLQLLPLILVGACTGGNPNFVVLTDASIPYQLAYLTDQGAHAWESLGIDAASPADNLSECPTTWFDDTSALPCAITVHLSFTMDSAIGNKGGTTNIATRTSVVASDLPVGAVQSVISRELGFSAFNTTDTIPDDDYGIMSASLEGITAPTTADATFASEHTNGWTK